MPNCNCSGNPEMKFITRREIGKPSPGSARHVSHQLKSGGHPLMAVLVTAAALGNSIANKVAEYDVYKCPECGKEKEKLVWK